MFRALGFIIGGTQSMKRTLASGLAQLPGPRFDQDFMTSQLVAGNP
jgi:hypothetical protein